MNKPWRRYLGQAVAYAAFAALIVYFVTSPEYTHLPPGQAVLKLAVRHSGAIVGECEPMDPALVANKPQNMQLPQRCPRARSALKLRLYLDDQLIYDAQTPASGLHHDGVSSVYQRFEIPAGSHSLVAEMNDDVAVEGYPHRLETTVTMHEAEVVVIGYKDGFYVQ